MYTRLSRNVFARVLDSWRHETTTRHLAELGRSQWWTRDQLLELQNDRLRSLMRHAYGSVPYYRRLFDEAGLAPGDIRVIDDLPKLPVLTRHDVRTHLNDLLATTMTSDHALLRSTGGSTGEPLIFYRSRDSLSAGAGAKLRAYEWAGYRLGDRQAMIWGSPIDSRAWQTLQGRLVNRFKRAIVLDSGHMDERSLAAFAARLRKHRPKLLIGYGSALHLMARYLNAKGICDVEPHAISSQAEMLLPDQRETIEASFKCRVFDFYGNREFETIAAECAEHCGYHVAAENVIVEFVHGGRPVAPGETGEVVVTDLLNYAMPFIRYACGDLGRSSVLSCPCGRGLPLIEALEGRVTDVLVTAAGTYISSPVLTLLFKELPLAEYRITQSAQGKIRIDVVPAEGYSEHTSKQIVAAMRRYVGERTPLQVQVVDSIPPTASGKRRVVVSHMPISFA